LDNAGEVVVKLRVQPRASRDAIVMEPDGRIRVALTSPPIAGRANKALVSLLSDVLGASKSSISVVSGETSRSKSVSIKGISASRVRERLARAAR
jgi:hypothetical protein